MHEQSYISEIADLLSGTDAFSGLERAQLELLAADFNQIQCQAGDLLISEGGRGHCLSILVEGQVLIFLPATQGITERISDVRLAVMSRGELFGEYGFVDLRPASASVRAINDCTLLQIDYGKLQHILNENSDLARKFYENLLLLLIDRLRKNDSELDLFSSFGA
jgi:CRP-like cAMP-binding protein